MDRSIRLCKALTDRPSSPFCSLKVVFSKPSDCFVTEPCCCIFLGDSSCDDSRNPNQASGPDSVQSSRLHPWLWPGRR